MTFNPAPWPNPQDSASVVGRPGGQPGYIYEWLAAQIAARITSGDLRPNTPLPAERRLADEYRVSLGTARRATELLRERGLVVTLRSKGTYVADHTQGR